MSCEECDHEGWNDCPDWNCDDGIINCEECEEGVIECDNCEGEWEGGDCEWCEGREHTELMTNMGDWNKLTPSVASFSKIMNNNDFPDLKWVAREVLKEEIKPSLITSDTIFMFHEPTWISQNPTVPPQLHIQICVVSLAAPVGPNEESEGLEANYKQLILTLAPALEGINKIGCINLILPNVKDAL